MSDNDITVVIADDEPAARRGLKRLLAAEPGVKVVGEARHGGEAVAMIESLRPDAAFLDIQMPELNGFEVIEALEGELPLVVFVTAYDEWAVRAFEVQALDYVLKPFEDERLHAVVQRIRARLAAAQPADMVARVRALLAERAEQPRVLTRLLVREGGVVQFVELSDVEWIEAADYYARLHMGDKTRLVRYSMNDLELQLDARHFLRVHRSAIINISAVKEIRVAHQNHHTIMLKSGAAVPLSRARKDVLEEALTTAK